MDDLRTTLLTLSPGEQREFGEFIQRQRRKSAGRQDSRLYELLVQPKELTTPQLIAKLYPGEPNPIAYYALRKRLMRHLTDYLVLRQRQLDTTAAASVWGLLTLAQYLFETGIPRLAWNTLRKAEKLARDNGQYEPLNAVYNLQIQHANSPYAEPLAEIIARRHANKKAADEEERANIADSLLRQRLREARKKGRAAAPLDTIMHDILVEYDLQEAFARSPSLLCRLLSIARSAMLVRRDFASFAVFTERCYRLMERRPGFAPAQRGYQLRLLYMLAHALYRSRHFAESIAYLEQGQVLLQGASARKYAELAPRFTFLLAANLGFIRRNAEGIALLEQALKASPALPLGEELTARLQLVFHYFAEGNFSKANQALLRLGRTDHWLEEHLGLEWLLNKNMAEMFIQLELGYEDLALARLKSIERSLREQFPAGPAVAGSATAPAAEAGPVGGPYQYILRFLELVHNVINDPAAAQRPAFAARVADLPTFLPLQREDLQALSFYAWLRARMLARPYYEVLLEVASR
ncbi:hypothetical protein IC235_03945 [Hymenobacter sp. BT664]|uniref:Tetratricopeptide repeat protein n=1 Tax=Hymenobacter montanus TaxID=2771359 RepID=A0A927BAA5_9BACT|nr:hypothetical protein [Hymenobacter montanus]MBD2767045.1 hypothetical protein [Hymenobacter montanus]